MQEAKQRVIATKLPVIRTIVVCARCKENIYHHQVQPMISIDLGVTLEDKTTKRQRRIRKGMHSQSKGSMKQTTKRISEF